MMSDEVLNWGDHFARLSLQHAALGILLLDEHGIIRFANTQAEQFFQVPESKIRGQDIHTLVHTGSIKQRSHRKISCQLLDVIANGGSVLRQSDVFWRKQLPFWVEYSIYPLVDAAGMKSFLLSFLDAEVAFRGKKKYLQSGAKYRIVFDMSSDPKVILNSDGTIGEANQAAASFFSLNTILHENFFLLFPKEGRGKLKELWKTRRRHKVRLSSLEFVKETKETLCVEMSIIPDILPDECLVIFRDTTARIIEQRQRDRFLALVGHELKTPLAVIKAFAQLLQSTTKPLADPKIERYLQHINEKTDLLTGLINGMMDAIHLGSGRLEFHDEKVRFDDLIAEIIFESQKMYPQRVLRLSGQTHAILVVDKHRITQVVSNLITNAVKYSPKETTVTIRMDATATEITLSVTDEGRGIPRAEQAKLFLPFFRGRQARVSQTQGLGLGLYLARQVVRHYKGTMMVKSKYGEGSTFSITLPIV